MSLRQTLQLRTSQQLALTPQLQQSLKLLQMSSIELRQELRQLVAQNPFLELLDGGESDDVGEGDSDAAAAAEPEDSNAAPDGAADSYDDDSATTWLDDSSAAEAAMPELRAEDFTAPEHAYEFHESDAPTPGESETLDFDNLTPQGFELASEFTPDAALDGLYDAPQPTAGSRDSQDNWWERARTNTAATLLAHLQEQLDGMRLELTQRLALAQIVGNLDEHGWLCEPLEQLVPVLEQDLRRHASALPGERSKLGADELRQQATALLHWALELVQGLQPAGIGARDLLECLDLQLLRLPASPARELARTLPRRLTEGSANALPLRQPERCARLLGTDLDTFTQALALLRRCQPHPAVGFEDEPTRYVTPDVLVRRIRAAKPAQDRPPHGMRGARAAHGAGTTDWFQAESNPGEALPDWDVRLNPAAYPSLRVDESLARSLPRGDARCAPLRELAGQARQLQKSLRLRGETVLRVARAIVARQGKFLRHGEAALTPMLMREVASELGIHPSTVSRVVNEKTMQTPRGVLEFRAFFSNAIDSSDGEAASSVAMKDLLRQWLESENPTKPLSDQALALRFQEHGYKLARRTVTKYREALGFAATHERRR